SVLRTAPDSARGNRAVAETQFGEHSADFDILEYRVKRQTASPDGRHVELVEIIQQLDAPLRLRRFSVRKLIGNERRHNVRSQRRFVRIFRRAGNFRALHWIQIILRPAKNVGPSTRWSAEKTAAVIGG